MGERDRDASRLGFVRGSGLGHRPSAGCVTPGLVARPGRRNFRVRRYFWRLGLSRVLGIDGNSEWWRLDTFHMACPRSTDVSDVLGHEAAGPGLVASEN